jgi:hypothetical protein
MTYLLDANVFIQAKNLHYGLDFCPAFWEWLICSNKAGSVFSIENVADEIKAGGDELSDWAKPLGNDFFLPTTLDMMPSLSAVSEWAASQDYESSAVHTFLSVADYYLVARALSGGHVVVTHEVPANSRYKIKIPNVCVGLGVKFMTPYSMLRREHARFVLGPSSI